MVAFEKVDWDTCAEEDCIGVRLLSNGKCWAHADDQALEAALGEVKRTWKLDARRVRLDATILARLLAAVPPGVEDRPQLSELQLDRATFTEVADFRRMQVGSYASLVRVRFQGPCNMAGVRFDGGVNLRDTIFDDTATFSDASLQWTSFGNASFNGPAEFERTVFGGGADFGSATFSSTATWLEARFDPNVNFRGTTFADSAGFPRATFGGHVGFAGAKFRNEANFDEAVFEGDAAFRGTSFFGSAAFNRATFKRESRFERAAFLDARFAEVTFHGFASFHEATFKSLARFHWATFHQDAHFGEVAFQGRAWFGWATFNGPVAKFGKATFSKDAVFDRATFQRDTEFDQVTIHHNARFEGVTFQRTRQLGSLLARKSLTLDGATFHERAQIGVSAAAFCCRRTRFLSGVQLRVRWAQVVLDDADLAAPSILTGVPSFARLDEDGSPARGGGCVGRSTFGMDGPASCPSVALTSPASHSPISTCVPADSAVHTTSTSCGSRPKTPLATLQGAGAGPSGRSSRKSTTGSG